eukprot:gb/GECG01015933.1/.p1 GENE.gb/GECG01015933.1/~~gb/GECG01015933.1/.p1  ORF type:complete len:172 (+),score=18.23 gb/GECG01015933.1/:1-516(+)
MEEQQHTYCLQRGDAEDTRLVITTQPIDVEAARRFVKSPKAGALSSFHGTTRDNFNGKIVEKLEYECYVPMAIKELRKLCEMAFSKWSLINVSVTHRTGVVPVCEESVVIWVSSAHRQDGLDAVKFLIDKLKERVPIWKKEWYASGPSGDSVTAGVWKANCECVSKETNDE